MSKKSQHPNFGVIEVTRTDGTKFKTRSTISKKMKSLTLDIDPLNHPAWNKDVDNKANAQRFSEVQKFTQKFEDLDDLV